MAYTVDVDPAARDQIAALPAAALEGLAGVFTMLELDPWAAGASINRDNPDAAVRTATFSSTPPPPPGAWPGGHAGLITYLIVEDAGRVDVLEVLWRDD